VERCRGLHLNSPGKRIENYSGIFSPIEASVESGQLCPDKVGDRHTIQGVDVNHVRYP
jgi:hypothetical protein